MEHRQEGFREWLKDNTKLSDSSIEKYVGAIKSISSWIDVDIYGMTAESEIASLMDKCISNSAFVERNTTGNSMYSNAIKYYTRFHSMQSVPANIDIIVIYPNDMPDSSPEYREGKKKTVQVNTYERNPAARKECINHYGAVCTVCGFDFGKVYGDVCDGMIHVHHLKMVSESDTEYVVDPINDLRPVCPNCHMVLHSKTGGCYTPEEVKAMLEVSRERCSLDC